ncbi:MAG: hypothetical protein KC656_02340 [Myxococcales bacterium]|nr:hypothetical protein [Myxococcales bacterium]MCB9671216.1 hypothetical protein [Alphaproteobacteria bacterium]
MSRCYRISVSESLARHVHVDDGLQTKLELLDILPSERMAELLGARLAERGYEAKEGSVWEKTLESGVVVRVDVATGTVDISLTEEAALELERKRSTTVADVDPRTVEEALRKKVKQQLEEEADVATEALRVEVTRKLEEALSGVRKELDDAVNRATADALKEKAKSLGEVTEITEDAETGAVTIRVRVG